MPRGDPTERTRSELAQHHSVVHLNSGSWYWRACRGGKGDRCEIGGMGVEALPIYCGFFSDEYMVACIAKEGEGRGRQQANKI